MRSSIVSRSNCSKSFLTRCVPDLQFYFFAIVFYCSYFEVDADGVDVGGGEGVVGEAEEEGGFADAGVAYYEEFEEVVVVGATCHF